MSRGDDRRSTADLALAFARALVAGDFDDAHATLGRALAITTSPAQLRQSYESMLDYEDAPPNDVRVMNEMHDWPGKAAGDLGWAYVSISGDCYAEAVTVIVAREAGRNVIRDVEWGRP